MSSPNENEGPELKAGHAPATKVGGMRVVQHKKDAEKVEQPPMTAEEKEEFGVGSPPKEKPGAGLVVSGAVTKEQKQSEPLSVKKLCEVSPDLKSLLLTQTTKGDKDFPAEAVKSFHEKPRPIHDNRPRGAQQTPQIHQPR